MNMITQNKKALASIIGVGVMALTLGTMPNLAEAGGVGKGNNLVIKGGGLFIIKGGDVPNTHMSFDITKKDHQTTGTIIVDSPINGDRLLKGPVNVGNKSSLRFMGVRVDVDCAIEAFSGTEDGSSFTDVLLSGILHDGISVWDLKAADVGENVEGTASFAGNEVFGILRFFTSGPKNGIVERRDWPTELETCFGFNSDIDRC